MPAGRLMPLSVFVPVLMASAIFLSGPRSAQDKKMADQAKAAVHWDAAYAQGDDTRSWYEEHPAMSLRMLSSAGISAADALIDVGGGASPLTGALLDRGFGDLTVLDISAAGMQHARDRLGPRADQVHWLTADVLSWHPPRHYQAWHDRAVYHFLTTDEHRQQYLHTWTRRQTRAPSPSSAASPRTGRSAARACQWPATARRSWPARSAPSGY